MIKKIMTWVAPPLALLGFGVLLWLEHKRPLRRAVSSKRQRLKINVGVAAITAGVVRLVFLPVIVVASRVVQQRHMGLLNLIPLPTPVRLAAAFLLLDYTFYWWHRMLHQVGFLWRFHTVHHTDLDLDVSTAARFHFGEWVFSTTYRGAQLVVIGAGPVAESIFEGVILLATEFHHSNIRLPIAFERPFNWFIVTPRMHGIHHSIVPDETNSNFATVVTAWDWLHSTLRLNVPQEEITIGLPAYRHPRQLSFSKLLVMPFGRQPETWMLPDGSQVEREEPPGPKTRMVT